MFLVPNAVRGDFHRIHLVQRMMHLWNHHQKAISTLCIGDGETQTHVSMTRGATFDQTKYFLNNLLSEVSNTTSYSFHHRPPKYMLIKQEIWLFDTIEACCEKNYRWKYEDCMASTAIDLFQCQLQQRMTCSIRIISFNCTSARTTDWNHLTWGMLMILSFGCTRLEELNSCGGMKVAWQKEDKHNHRDKTLSSQKTIDVGLESM